MDDHEHDDDSYTVTFMVDFIGKFLSVIVKAMGVHQNVVGE